MGVLAMCLAAVAALSVNVRDFGAVGDGVHDDTLALQRAADSLRENCRLTEGRDYGPMRTRFRRDAYIEHGPVREIFFPAGTYRVAGSVMFTHSVMLRGEPGAVVKSLTPEAPLFYLHRALYARVTGLEFDGGRYQLVIWNRNCSGPIVIDRCTFRNCAGEAINHRSFIPKDKATARPNGDPSCNANDISQFVINRLPDRRVELVERDPGTLRDSYSSPLLLIDRCRFLDNAQAINIEADGEIIRDCTFRVPRTAKGAAVRIGSKTLVRNVEMEILRNPDAEQFGFDCNPIMNVFDNCRIVSDGEVTPFSCSSRPFSSVIASRLALKDLSVDCGAAPLVKFARDVFPSIFSVHGLRRKGADRAAPMFAFEQEPTAADVKRWIAEAAPRGRLGAGGRAVRNRFAIAVEGAEKSGYALNVPEVFRDCVRTVPPGLVRDEKEFFTWYEPADFGVEFTDAEIGAESYREPKAEDPAKVAALFARAEREAGGRPRTVVLPAKWVETDGTLELRGRVRVTGAGFTILTSRDCTKPIFRIAEGADVVFDNIFFRRGLHVVDASAKTGLVRFYCCNFYDQWEESVHAVADRGSAMRIEVSGGDFAGHRYYRGNSRLMLLDCTEFNPGLDHPIDIENPITVNRCCPVENLAGGTLEFHSVLSSPMFFEDVWPMSKINADPTPAQLGDYRWLDNRGVFNAWEMRFGGEWGGMTSVYQYGEDAECYVEGGYSWNLCRRLKSGRAFAVADIAAPRMTMVEIGSNWDDRTGASVYAVSSEKDGFRRLDSPKVFLCYPFE